MRGLILFGLLTMAAFGAEPPPALVGDELVQLMRLRAEAAEARVAHLTAVNQAQERIREADKLALNAQAAAQAIERFAVEKAGDSGCVLQPDGGWECAEKVNGEQ